MEHPVAYFHCALAALNCYRKNNSNQRILIHILKFKFIKNTFKLLSFFSFFVN